RWSSTKTCIGSATSAAPRASSSGWPSKSADARSRALASFRNTRDSVVFVQAERLLNKHQECVAEVRRDFVLRLFARKYGNDRHLSVGSRAGCVEAELGAPSDGVKGEEARTRMSEGEPDGVGDGRVLEVVVDDAVDFGAPEVPCSILREEAAIRGR